MKVGECISTLSFNIKVNKAAHSMVCTNKLLKTASYLYSSITTMLLLACICTLQSIYIYIYIYIRNKYTCKFTVTVVSVVSVMARMWARNYLCFHTGWISGDLHSMVRSCMHPACSLAWLHRLGLYVHTLQVVGPAEEEGTQKHHQQQTPTRWQLMW